mmetsp:Transcript_73066/g.143286  ORF Transcript_73066/g.143286 Transcript_73066/m.143286 type:complete len:344 (-) Transcript_73066:72-1103(-)
MKLLLQFADMTSATRTNDTTASQWPAAATCFETVDHCQADNTTGRIRRRQMRDAYSVVLEERDPRLVVRAFRNVRGNPAQSPISVLQVRSNLAHRAVAKWQGQVVVDSGEFGLAAAEVDVPDARISAREPCALHAGVHGRVALLAKALATQLATLHARTASFHVLRGHARRPQGSRASTQGTLASALAIAEEVAMGRVPCAKIVHRLVALDRRAEAGFRAIERPHLRRAHRRVRPVDHRWSADLLEALGRMLLRVLEVGQVRGGALTEAIVRGRERGARYRARNSREHVIPFSDVGEIRLVLSRSALVADCGCQATLGLATILEPIVLQGFQTVDACRHGVMA